jgi:hypothetical protein
MGIYKKSSEGKRYEQNIFINVKYKSVSYSRRYGKPVCGTNCDRASEVLEFISNVIHCIPLTSYCL